MTSSGRAISGKILPPSANAFPWAEIAAYGSSFKCQHFVDSIEQ